MNQDVKTNAAVNSELLAHTFHQTIIAQFVKI